METNRTYISYVIQSPQQHVHDFAIINLPRPDLAVYGDNSSEEVVKWSIGKQKELPQQDKLVILNYFNISNIN
ncbi:MAG: hypothetical protein ABI921_01935 [Panacibacter sp.]